jgi:hypothetical protein
MHRLRCARAVQFDAGKFFFFWLNVTVACMTMAYLGMVMVCITPNLQMGALLARLLLLRCIALRALCAQALFPGWHACCRKSP